MGKKAKKNQKTKPFTGQSAFATRSARSRISLESKSRRNIILISLLLFGLVLGIYWPSLQGTFLYFDEHSYLVTNPHVNSGLKWQNITWAISSLEFSNWYPLTWLSHMLDVQIYGMKPWGHHLTNVLLHAFNTMLVFLVFRKLLGSLWQGIVIAGLFGLHPLRVESVAWISERKDVLSTLFWLLAMWTYARFAEELKKENGRIKTFYALTLLFFALGLASKTMLVTLPFVFLLLDYWPLKRWQQEQKWKLVAEKIPLFLMTIGVSILSYLAQKRGGMTSELPTLPFIDKLGNATVSYPRYLEKFFWPENLCIFYPHPGAWPKADVIAAAIFLVLVSGLAFVFVRRMPYLFVGWFWFLGTFIPVINLVQLGSQAMADRYTYVPLIGIYLVLVVGLTELSRSWPRRTFILSAASAAALLACATLTCHELKFWKDDVSVWTRATQVTKDNYMAYDNLGIVLEPDHNDEAMVQFENAVRINPYAAGAQQSLADQYLIHGRLDEAIVHYADCLKIYPTSIWGQYGMGLALFKRGYSNEAIIHLQRAVDLDPSNSIHQDQLGLALYVAGRKDEAFLHFQKAVESNPADASAQAFMGEALLRMNKPQEAVGYLQQALKLNPGIENARAALNGAMQMIQTNQQTEVHP